MTQGGLLRIAGDFFVVSEAAEESGPKGMTLTLGLLGRMMLPSPRRTRRNNHVRQSVL